MAGLEGVDPGEFRDERLHLARHDSFDTFANVRSRLGHTSRLTTERIVFLLW